MTGLGNTFIAAADKPLYPTGAGPVYVQQGTLERLGEQIAALTIKGVCDKDGLRICVRGKLSDLPDLARQVIAQWLHTSTDNIIVVGEDR